ncbi:hypothetical protein GYA13_02190 [Candidatus Kuenenbacteria bacterium]|nr:hypothetical protein [Candidatus Kuenenbacteria bacterium]
MPTQKRTRHPSHQQLREYVEANDKDDNPKFSRLKKHLSNCHRCQRSLDDITSLDHSRGRGVSPDEYWEKFWQTLKELNGIK